MASSRHLSSSPGMESARLREFYLFIRINDYY